jgi:hypothetical protein
MIATSNNENPHSVHDHDLPGADSIPCCSADASGADMSIIRTMTSWYLLLLLPLTSVANAASTPSYHQCTSSPQCKLHPAVLQLPNFENSLEANPRSEWSLFILIKWHNWFERHNSQHETISPQLFGSFVTTLQRIKQRARWDSEIARQKHIYCVQYYSITLFL